MQNKEGTKFLRVSKKGSISELKVVLIKAITLVFTFLLCGIISTCIVPGSFGDFYSYLIQGTFLNGNVIVNLLWEAGILFLIALALTPAFKMRFWNIGGEGQGLMGGLGALIIMKFVAPYTNNFVALILMLLAAIVFGIIWAVIPAIFKAFFETNETLFTLMMNYISMCIIGFFARLWSTTGSNVLGIVNGSTKAGWMPFFPGMTNSYVWNVLIIIAVAALLFIYLNYSKHGYEISVVGESRNTARYIGISTHKVIIRTVILSGALCGLAGFLLVAGSGHSIASNTMGGKGFTAILVSWLGGFSVPKMAFYAFLVAFVTKGSTNAAGWIGYDANVASALVGLFFICLIASDFFVKFDLHISWNELGNKFKFIFNKFKSLFKKKTNEAEGGNE